MQSVCLRLICPVCLTSCGHFIGTYSHWRSLRTASYSERDREQRSLNSQTQTASKHSSEECLSALTRSYSKYRAAPRRVPPTLKTVRPVDFVALSHGPVDPLDCIANRCHANSCISIEMFCLMEVLWNSVIHEPYITEHVNA